MKKILLLIVFILLLGGCYDYTEINDLSLITLMIIDYEDNMFKITSQAIENQNKTQMKQYITKCNTIDECIYKITEYSNKDIFISHLKTLIITENTITNSNDFYDYFLREPKSKMNFQLYYIENDKINDLMNLFKDNKIDSLYLKDLTKFNHKLYSSSTELYFLDYIKKRLDYGITPIYPSLSIKDNKPYLDNLVFFNKNNKKGILNNNEAIYYNMITNSITKSLLDLPCDDNNYSLEIDYPKTKLSYDNDILNININLKSTISSYNCNIKLNNKDNISKISNLTNDNIKNNINDLINKSKNYDADFIGLSSYIYKHTKKKINIKDIKTNVKVNTIIESLGEMKNELQ